MPGQTACEPKLTVMGYLAGAGRPDAPRNVSVETVLYATDEFRESETHADKDHTGRPTDY